jgi:hypothetical protein
MKIHLLPAEQAKVELMDKLLDCINTSTVEHFIDGNAIVNELDGSSIPPMRIMATIITQHNELQNTVIMLTVDAQAIRADLQLLLNVLNGGYASHTTSGNFNALKNKYGIY